MPVRPDCRARPVTQRAASALTRDRLVNALGAPAAVTVIQSPLGTGKTVLVDSWLASAWFADTAVAQVPAPAPGTAAADYWLAVAEALRATVGERIEFRHPARSSDLAGAGVDPVRAQLSAIPGDVVLVLDHPDRVMSADLEDKLLELLEDHAGLHLVVSLRTSAMFATARARNQRARRIGAADLRFIPEETSSLFTQTGVTLPDQLIGQLHEALGGASALVAEAANALGSFADEQPPYKSSWRNLRAAISTLLYDGWLDRDQVPLYRADLVGDILELAAVLGAVDERTLAELLGNDVLSGLPAVFAEFGALLSADAPQGEWQLVPIVRQVVLGRLRATRRESRRSVELLQRMREVFVESSDHESSLRCAMLTEDWDLTLSMLQENWSTLLAYPQLVGDVLEALPQDIAARDASISAWRSALIGLGAGMIDKLAMIANAPQQLAAREGLARPLIDEITVGTAHAVMHRLAGEFGESSVIASQMASMLDDASSEQQRAVASALPVMRLQWAISHQLAADSASANSEFRRAFAGATTAQNEPVARNAAGSLAMDHALRGEVTHAVDFADTESNYGLVRGTSGTRVRVGGLVAKVITALDRMDTQGAEAALMDLGQPGAAEELWAPMVVARCGVLQAQGHADIGLDLIIRASSTFRHWITEDSLARQLLSLTAAHLYSSLGRGNAALDALSWAPPDHPATRVVKGTVLLLGGDAAGALTEVETALGRNDAPPRVTVGALMVAGAAQVQIGAPERARRNFLRATEMARQAGLMRTLLTLPRTWRARLLAEGLIERDLAQAWGEHDGVELNPAEIRLVLLTARERAVVQRLASGDSLATIAKSFFTSPNTVKTQMRTLYRKLGVNTREEAVREAKGMSLI